MITLTDQATENIKRLQIENDAVGHGLRFGLTGGGCSGYRYVIEFEKEPSLKDQIFKFKSFDVFVSSEHIAGICYWLERKYNGRRIRYR